MRITLEIKCPTCLSDSIKKNGIKVDGKQNYQCKDCKRQFIGDHALSYLGCNSGITRKILQLMVRGSGIRDIAESNVNRTIKKVEDALMKSRRFTLPKRSITTADEHFNWVIIDATECSIERPKKKSE